MFYPLEKESKEVRSSLPEAIPSQILALIVAYEARDRHNQIRDKSCDTCRHCADGGFIKKKTNHD